MLITAVYGNDHIGMRSVSKNAYLEGNKVVTPMKIADTDYDVELTFNEDARETSETTDERTVWYLGRRNSEENISKGGAEYVGGLRLYRTKPVSPNNPVLEDKVFVKKHYNLVDADYKALGTLDLTIRGQEVTFVLTQAAGLGEQSGATQIRRVRLVRSTVREGLYESEKMKSAQVAVGNAPGKKSIMSDGTGTYGNSETVFVFRSNSDLTNTDVEKHKYNTYEFLVTECNPKDGTFFLKGWHCLDAVPTDAGKGGQPVQASAQTTIFYNEGTGAKRLDGGLFNGKDAK